MNLLHLHNFLFYINTTTTICYTTAISDFLFFSLFYTLSLEEPEATGTQYTDILIYYTKRSPLSQILTYTNCIP